MVSNDWAQKAKEKAREDQNGNGKKGPAKSSRKQDQTERREIKAGDSPVSANEKPETDRPIIVISTEEHEVNDEAVQALANDSSIYQRGGLLVQAVTDDSHIGKKGIARSIAPRIEAIPPAILRERLTKVAVWKSIKVTKDGKASEVPDHPPSWCYQAVGARANWPGIRYLEAVIEYPILRKDGTILHSPGYDASTGLLLIPRGKLPVIPMFPSLADAKIAANFLLKVVEDFPFENGIHRSAFLAAMLTPLARFAFQGPAPLFLVDANVRAAGKGLLLDIIALIITGERFTIAT